VQTLTLPVMLVNASAAAAGPAQTQPTAAPAQTVKSEP
jgi:hypothetical protein